LSHSATIFALDTSSDIASLALYRNGRVLASQSLPSGDGYAHVIFPVIEGFLQEASVKLKEIDCFASASGPGSFTGVRVCLSVVKGLATALDKPAAGVSNLKALASTGVMQLRAPLIDARRGDFYGALYDSDLSLMVPEGVMPLSEWTRVLEGFQYESVRLSNEKLQTMAIAIARCAAEDLTSWVDPGLLDANYVRHSDAEKSWRQR
jgi:tRNA threonylcarbamoyladenosine biosynthesis protein TsaB